MLILFLLTFHSKRLLTSALIHFSKIRNFSKSVLIIEFKELLLLAAKESYFIFNGKLYKQVDGVAMGSPLGPTLGNAFPVHFEKNWLQNCPSDFKPRYYGRYVDEMFVLFTPPKHLEAFQYFQNGPHVNMSFTIESEEQNRMSFLDLQIICVDKTFTTSVYCKPTFSGV